MCYVFLFFNGRTDGDGGFNYRRGGSNFTGTVLVTIIFIVLTVVVVKTLELTTEGVVVIITTIALVSVATGNTTGKLSLTTFTAVSTFCALFKVASEIFSASLPAAEISFYFIHGFGQIALRQ